MKTVTSVQSLRRMTSGIALLFLLVLTMVLSACGSDAPTTSTAAATTVTITEATGGNDIYAFDPTTVAIKAGGALKFVNNSDENHKLVITPAGPTAGTVTKSGSNDNTLTVTFPTAGTFTITSQLVDRLTDGKHTPDPADSKATITVTVS